ncbi:MAG: hypothetical protein AAB706_02920 [Patescibacteria group bacterium]
MLQTIKKSRKVLTYGGLVVLFLLGSLITTLLLNGYSFGPNLLLQAPGTIILSVPKGSSQVIVDDKLKTITQVDDEKITLSGLSPRLHTIFVTQENFWPWGKNIIVKEHETIEISSFITPRVVQVAELLQSHPRYRELVNLINKSSLPNVSNPKIFADGTLAVWVEGGNKIIAEWRGEDKKKPWYFSCTDDKTCPSLVTIITTESPIKSTDFYGKERDIIMIALKDGVYALEVGPVGIQNFQPLYTGENPRFYKENFTGFFVLDGKKLMEISF